MGKLVVNKDVVNSKTAQKLIELCPFNAISYKDGVLDISSACKMCKMCVKKGDGVIDFVEEHKEIDKSLWKGICVFADISGDSIHRVTYELCGKAKELAKVINHPVYAVLIGSNIKNKANELLKYGVDKVFIYDNKAFETFRIEPFTAAFYDFIQKYKPSSVLIGATNLGRQLAPRIAAHVKRDLLLTVPFCK